MFDQSIYLLIFSIVFILVIEAILCSKECTYSSLPVLSICYTHNSKVDIFSCALLVFLCNRIFSKYDIHLEYTHSSLDMALMVHYEC